MELLIYNAVVGKMDNLNWSNQRSRSVGTRRARREDKIRVLVQGELLKEVRYRCITEGVFKRGKWLLK
jgi:hypothetical protein